MTLNQMKIGPRLSLGFGVVLLLAVALAGTGLHRIAALGHGLDVMVNYNEAKNRLVTAIERALLERAVAARNLVLISDPGIRKRELADIAEAKKSIDTHLQSLAELLTAQYGQQDEARQSLQRLQALEARYWPVAQRIVALSNEGKRDEAAAALAQECIPLLEELKSVISAYAETSQAATKQQLEALRSGSDHGSAWLMGLALASLVLGALLARTIQRSVVVPLKRVGGSIRRLATGDLGERLEHEGRDEVSAIAADVAQMQQHLRAVVSTIRRGVDSVSAASNEIATGNLDLSHRTEQTASNLQRTASSMTQLTDTVRQSADAARQANELATSAAAVAERGGVVVSEVVATMGEINAASKKIADIISVIDGIAFQTNILALNAAVEAARAGDQGRGFAVVAAEVRSLAGRSAQAAREIKDLIGASVEKVESGAQLVENAGRTMDEIVSSVERVSNIIGEITNSAREQSEGIGQVNGAVNQLDQMTQQNAALVEESAAAAASLKEQAGRLSQALSGFRLEATASVSQA